jgi:hypothetical protein
VKPVYLLKELELGSAGEQPIDEIGDSQLFGHVGRRDSSIPEGLFRQFRR